MTELGHVSHLRASVCHWKIKPILHAVSRIRSVVHSVSDRALQHQGSVTSAAGVVIAMVLILSLLICPQVYFSYLENKPHFPLFPITMTLPNDQKDWVWWQKDHKFKAILPMYQALAYQDDLTIAVTVEGRSSWYWGLCCSLLFWSIFQDVDPWTPCLLPSHVSIEWNLGPALIAQQLPPTQVSKAKG